jgi:hypothetical protein
MIHCTPYTKATPASVQGASVYFYFDIDFASPQRLKRVRHRTARFRFVFGSTDGFGILKELGGFRLAYCLRCPCVMIKSA